MQVPGSANPIMLGGAKDYTIARSLRLRASASAYLSRTPSAGNRTTWTWSAWIKRGTLGVSQYLLTSNTGASDSTFFNFNFGSNDTLNVSGWATGYLTTTQVFRDPSAYYHVVFALDTGNATASNRMKLYINGVQVTSFTTANYPTLSQTTGINQAAAHNIGALGGGSNFDGYMSDVHFIDGQALTPSSFGETDLTTGVWKPKKYAGAYGTNGFYLNFSDNSAATAAAIGKDTSGNGNNWTPNNISVTSGATYDSMTDVPTSYSDGGTVRGNFCVMNPLRTNNGTLTNGNLTASSASASYKGFSSTIAMTSGKWYWEVTCTSIGFVTSIGITNSTTVSGITTGMWSYHYDGSKYLGGSNSAYGASYTSGDVLGFAFDADAGSLTCYKNGVSQGVLVSGLPAADYYAYATLYGTWNIGYNFGQRPFAYTPPTGFVALNTFNLPDPTIKKPGTNFNVVTYTGNGSTQSITGVGFQPDLVWSKARNIASNHGLFDIVRGVSKWLSSSATDAESTISGVTSFDSDGFSLGSSYNAAYNYVAWNWKAGNSAGSSNTAGSITSTVSANAAAGFSVVTYTGNGTAGATVGHGLGVAPSMIIVKNRSGVNNWNVYHKDVGATKNLHLNLTDAAVTSSVHWNNTAPTSSVFSIGTSANANKSPDNYVAYCFSEVAGYSKFGSYTGNGSADGAFVHCGFRPRYILIKSAGTANGWGVFDTARNAINVNGTILEPNSSNAEATYTQWQIDILSNGFKVRSGSFNETNGSGVSYIFAAFAEHPFKYSLAR